MDEDRPPLSISEVRRELGLLWGLDRTLTKVELARALSLSPDHGADHIARLEKGKTTMSGPIEVALRMMLSGAKPHTMNNLITPGYPRGFVVE